MTCATGPHLLVAFGSNAAFGDLLPIDVVKEALEGLEKRGFSPSAASALYATRAVPAGSGPDYVNAVAAFVTGLAPAEALAALHAEEARLGRRRAVRWGPRTLDLDLLACGDRVLPDAATQRAWSARTGEAQREVPEGLILPHPRLQDRAFVLVPLAEVAPAWRHPLTGLGPREMLDRLPEAERRSVVRIGPLSALSRPDAPPK